MAAEAIYSADGKRRPVPSRWGFNPTSPWLEPPRGVPDKAPQHIRQAVKFWRSRETYDARNRLLSELLRRRRGRRSKRHGTESREAANRRFKRGDRTAVHHRFAIVLATHADARTGLVGIYQDGDVSRFFDRDELARRTGCTSLWQLDRVIADFVAAGFIHRHQGRELDDHRGAWRGRVALLRIRKAFWRAIGGQRLVEMCKAWGRKQARKAQAPTPDATDADVRDYLRDVGRGHAFSNEELEAARKLEEFRRHIERPPPT